MFKPCPGPVRISLCDAVVKLTPPDSPHDKRVACLVFVRDRVFEKISELHTTWFFNVSDQILTNKSYCLSGPVVLGYVLGEACSLQLLEFGPQRTLWATIPMCKCYTSYHLHAYHKI